MVGCAEVMVPSGHGQPQLGNGPGLLLPVISDCAALTPLVVPVL